MSDPEDTSGSSSSQSEEQIASHPVDKYIEERKGKSGSMSRGIPRELELDFLMSTDAEHRSEGRGGTSTETSSSDVDNAADIEGDANEYYRSSSSSPSSSPTTGQHEIVVKNRVEDVEGSEVLVRDGNRKIKAVKRHDAKGIEVKDAPSLRLPPPLESLEAGTAAPSGVVIVDEKAFETRTSEMARLLRQPRCVLL